MKKRIFLFGLVTALSAIAAEPVRITGFEPEDTIAVKSIMNCKTEQIEANADESIPDGKYYLKVTLGGINKQQGGGVIVPIPAIPDDAEAISIWIKGQPDNTFGPVIMFGDWCWRGMRYEKKAEVTVDESEWCRYEFKLNEFVPALNRPTKGTKKLNEYKCFYIQLGPAIDYSNPTVFFIDKIEIK